MLHNVDKGFDYSGPHTYLPGVCSTDCVYHGVAWGCPSTASLSATAASPVWLVVADLSAGSGWW